MKVFTGEFVMALEKQNTKDRYARHAQLREIERTRSRLETLYDEIEAETARRVKEEGIYQHC